MGAGENVWDRIKYLLYTAKPEDFKLARIEFLVVATAVILLLMFVLDTRRRRSHSSHVKYILLILDAASSSMVTYTIALMQIAIFRNNQFPVWAVLLLTLQQGIDYIFGRQNRRRKGLKNLVNSFWAANLAFTRGREFKFLIWLFWGLNLLKIILGMVAVEVADRSYSHGGNSMFMAKYMTQIHHLGSPEMADPVTMTGYKYLVHKKKKLQLEAQPPDYAILLKPIDKTNLITLEEIWQCKGHLLSGTGEQQSKLKDLCLSFAMYKLLRLKFDNVYPLPGFHDPWTSKLVFQGLLAENNYQSRAFRVIEVELAFLNDFLFTRYPIFFCQGLPFFYFILCLLVVASCCFLLSALFPCRPPPPENVTHSVDGVNVDIAITLFILVVIIIKEVLELVTYMLSEWAKVFLLCKYVERPSWQRCPLIEKALKLWCKFTIVKCWHKELRQYCLLESYDYKPRLRNLLSYATLGVVSKGTEGGRKGTKIKLPKDVEVFIVRSLRDQSQQPDQSQPPYVPSPFDSSNGLFSQQRNEMISEQLSSAFRGKTDTHTILVWHIATTMCEIELSEHYYDVDIELKRISFFKSCIKIFHSSLLSMNNGCFWRKKNLIKIDRDLRSRYNVAASLSKYCAYLVVFCPDLLPDHSLATESIFKDTITDARNILQGCDSMRKRYEKMMELGKKAVDKREEANAIINMGAKLCKALKEATKEDEAKLWKVLSEFWVELVLYLAPSSNTSAHKDCLATGGEFMTHLWALVFHAGFLKRPPPPQPHAGNP